MIKHEPSRVNDALAERFQTLLERHVEKLTTRGARATGLCPFHSEKTPSLSINIAQCVFHCFGCGVGGGVKKFSELVGEPWAIASLPRSERRRVAVSMRRREAEQRAREILQQQEEKRLDAIFRKCREVNRDAAYAAGLLELFHVRPDLEAEFSDVAAKAESEYSTSIHRRVLLEAQLNEEVM